MVHNTGNMGVEGVTVQGDTNDCSSALLAPDARLFCTLQRTLTASDFVASTFTVSITGVSGTPRGVRPLQALSPVFAQLPNPNVSTALLSVSVTANTSTVDRAGQTVQYTITLVSAADCNALYEWASGKLTCSGFAEPAPTGCCATKQPYSMNDVVR